MSLSIGVRWHRQLAENFLVIIDGNFSAHTSLVVGSQYNKECCAM